jgi:hypothetical protein
MFFQTRQATLWRAHQIMHWRVGRGISASTSSVSTPRSISQVRRALPYSRPMRSRNPEGSSCPRCFVTAVQLVDLGQPCVLAQQVGQGTAPKPLTVQALIIAGQTLGAMLLDHFGQLGFSVHPANAMRLFGAALLVGSVARRPKSDAGERRIVCRREQDSNPQSRLSRAAQI